MGWRGWGVGGRDLVVVAVGVVVVVVYEEEEKEAERDALGGGCAREGDPGSNRPWGIGSCWPVDSWDGL